MNNLTDQEREIWERYRNVVAPGKLSLITENVFQLLTTIAELRRSNESRIQSATIADEAYDQLREKCEKLEKALDIDVELLACSECTKLREKCEAQAIQLQFTNSNWPHEKKLHEELTKLRAQNSRLTWALKTIYGMRDQVQFRMRAEIQTDIWECAEEALAGERGQWKTE